MIVKIEDDVVRHDKRVNYDKYIFYYKTSLFPEKSPETRQSSTTRKQEVHFYTIVDRFNFFYGEFGLGLVKEHTNENIFKIHFKDIYKNRYKNRFFTYFKRCFLINPLKKKLHDEFEGPQRRLV